MAFTYKELGQAIKDFTENEETSFVNNLDLFIRSAEDRILYLADLEDFRKNATASLTQNDPYLSMPSDFLAPFSLRITSSGNEENLLIKDVNFISEYGKNVSNGVPKYYGIFDSSNFILGPTPDSAYTVELHYYYSPLSLCDTAVTMTLSGVSGTFTAGEYVQGSTSQTVGQIASVGVNSIDITPRTISGSGFLAANRGSGSSYGTTETITGLSSSATATTSQITNNKTWLSENAPNALLYGSLVEAYTYMKGEADMLQLYEQRFGQEIQRLKDFAEARENSDAYRRGLPDRPRT